MTFAMDFLMAVWHTAAALAPSLFLGLLVAGLLHVLVRKERIYRHLGKPGTGSVIKASLLGIPVPLCSCGVLPAALSLRRDGASRGATVSFLSSTPQTGVDSIIPTWVMLGWQVAAAKVLAAFAAGVLGGKAADIFEKGNGHQPEPAGRGGSEKGSIPVRIWRYSFGTLFKDIHLWLLIGIAVSALITVFIRPGQLADYPVLQGPLGLLAALAVGIPMYVCSVSSIPVAAALVYAGFPVGSALVFLMAGPVTNAATMAAVRKELGRVSFYSYIGAVTVVSLLAGLLLNGLDIAGSSIISDHGTHSITASIAAVAMFAGMIYHTWKDLASRLKSPVDRADGRVIVYSVEGMSCRNCAGRVKNAIEVLPGVESVQVSLDQGTAEIVSSGELSDSSVVGALKDAGYTGKSMEGSTCGCGNCGE